MAIRKGLRDYLDKEVNGSYKKTKKNIAKVLGYYGYTTKEIQEIFQNQTDFFGRYLEGMELRDLITARRYFTEEEQDLVAEYADRIDAVYDKRIREENQGTSTTEPKRVAIPKKVPSTTRKKVAKPSRVVLEELDESEEDIYGGAYLNESDIQSNSLLAKLHKVAGDKHKTQTREEVEDNRNEEQKPIDKDLPSGGKCDMCDGRGWIMQKQPDGRLKKVVCPKCLGNPVQVESVEFTRLGVPYLEELIPNKVYFNSKFSVQTLLEDNEEAYRSATRQFDKYIGFMEGILSTLRSGELPTKSYYIGTPDGYGKKHFVYQCMKELVRFGYKPTQLLNGGALLDDFNKKEYTKLNELLEGDVIFISISGLGKTFGLGYLLKYVADVAERKGIPVIVLGQIGVDLLLKSKDKPLLTLFARYTDDGDLGHFQSEGFTGSDAYLLWELKKKRLSGSIINQ